MTVRFYTTAELTREAYPTSKGRAKAAEREAWPECVRCCTRHHPDRACNYTPAFVERCRSKFGRLPQWCDRWAHCGLDARETYQASARAVYEAHGVRVPEELRRGHAA